jgi:putative protease
MFSMVELMSPAGSFASLQAAINAGADSVYFGIGTLHMRSRSAQQFSFADLKEIVERCKKADVRSYLVVNTILYDEDLDEMRQLLQEAKKQKVSAVIASDLAAIQAASALGLEVHISVQQNISNIESVRFFSQFANTVVLARELTLEQIKHIADQIHKQKITGPSGNRMQIELFAHGALCVAKAGTCSMSLTQYNSSANRGACFQICRRAYRVTDEETGAELTIDNKYVMSPKDLCTIQFLDQIIAAGVSILKLEGRGRSPDYVGTVTRVYREAIDSVEEGTYSREKAQEWTAALETVFNRGFWHGGYYLGNKLGEWSNCDGSKATKKKILVGKVLNYFPQAGVVYIHASAEGIAIGDTLLITGSTTGAVTVDVEEILVDDQPVKKAKNGQKCTIPCPELVRRGDTVCKQIAKLSPSIRPAVSP